MAILSSTEETLVLLCHGGRIGIICNVSMQVFYKKKVYKKMRLK